MQSNWGRVPRPERWVAQEARGVAAETGACPRWWQRRRLASALSGTGGVGGRDRSGGVSGGGGWGFWGQGEDAKGGVPRYRRETAVLPLTPQQTEEQNLSQRHGPAAGVSPPAVRPPEAPRPNWLWESSGPGAQSIRGSQATGRGGRFPCRGDDCAVGIPSVDVELLGRPLGAEVTKKSLLLVVLVGGFTHPRGAPVVLPGLHQLLESAGCGSLTVGRQGAPRPLDAGWAPPLQVRTPGGGCSGLSPWDSRLLPGTSCHFPRSHS